MLTSTRLKGLKSWCYENLCQGKQMKAPSERMDITKINTQEPQCFLAWAPSRLDRTGFVGDDTQRGLISVCPCIIIMPNHSYAKYMEEKRFDRYNDIHRPKQLGQHLSCSMLFSVYEPGIRMPGFVESAGEGGKGLDMSLIKEGTEAGLFTLTDWMDECRDKMLGARAIPKTDLIVEEESMTYSLYTDQSYVVDRRPIYYGFVNVTFNCYAEERGSTIENLMN